MKTSKMSTGMELMIHKNFDKLPFKLKFMLNKDTLTQDWLLRPIIKYKKYNIPAYFDVENNNYYHNPIDVSLYENLVINKEKNKNKKILDLGSGTGLGTIILKDNGFDVTGIERNFSNLNGGIYTMLLNDIYYNLIYSNEKFVKKTNYDVLIINQSFDRWDFVNTLVPVIREETKRGKEVLFYTAKDHNKLMNFEKYRPKEYHPYDAPIELY